MTNVTSNETKNVLMYTRADYKMSDDEIIKELAKVTGIEEDNIKEMEFVQKGKALIIYVDGVGMEMTEEDLQEIIQLMNEEVE